MPDDPKPIEIIAQLSGFRSQAAGGWRLTMDLFDSRIEDILSVAALVNASMTVKVKLEPMEGK
ncbi:MAG: hypothetical protein ACYDG4_13470 [Desulfuromonadaceae bacterium]